MDFGTGLRSFARDEPLGQLWELQPPCPRGRMLVLAVLSALLGMLPAPAFAGVYHRPVADEILQPVPQWSRFFDTVIPKLRSLAPPDPLSGLPASPLRQQALQKIEQFARQPPQRLTADDFADWSGLLIRLLSVDGRSTLEEARRVLDRGRAQFPRDFRLAAHLTTVYQLAGEYDRAAALAQETLELAPPEAQAAERLHLRLILSRRSQEHERRLGKLPKEEAVLDDLFGLRWWESGPLPWPSTPALSRTSPSNASEHSSPPQEAGELLQQLLIWFPFDGPLWWLLGEYLVARQEWSYAAQAFQAASDLRIGGKVFRQRRAQVLEQAERLRPQKEATALPDVPDLADPAAISPRTAWWARFGWQAWALLILGSLILFFLAWWQLRIWMRRLLQRFH